jgi:asparagine synthase (glutamine-hydrolysing)
LVLGTLNGIVALVNYKSDKSSKLAKAMCKSLEQRGREDSGIFMNSKVTLGNVASVTDTSKFAHQPLSNKTKSAWITFDGAIKNYGKLRSQLADCKFSTSSDAELVLHLYERNGEKCVGQLDGIFAFIIWDFSKKRLLCARDRFGVKPLYYFRNGNKGIFASQIKALLVDPSVPSVPNHELIGKYLLTGYHYRSGSTFFASIRSVLPGHYITWDLVRDCFEINEYWHLQTAAVPLGEDVDYSSMFLSLLRAALQGIISWDVPFAMLVSGGMDSQTIASLIIELAGSRYADKYELISAISNRWSKEDDEKPYIREYERFRNARISYVFLPHSLPWKDVRDLVCYLEEPMGLLNSCLLFYIAKELQRKGVKVAMSGNAADAFLWGLDFEQRRYLNSLKETKNFWKFLVETVGFMVQRDFSHNILSKLMEGLRSLMPSKLIFDASQFFDQQYMARYCVGATESLVDQTIGDIVQSTVTSDRIFSAFSVEIRHPFLDAELVDFLIRLPPDQKIRRGLKKYILRKASRGLIPEAVRKSRKKIATSIPLVDWLIGLRPEITEILLSKRFRDRKIFQPSKILKAFRSLCAGKLNKKQTREFTVLLWRIIGLELWFQIYIDPSNSSIINSLRRERENNVLTPNIAEH